MVSSSLMALLLASLASANPITVPSTKRDDLPSYLPMGNVDISVPDYNKTIWEPGTILKEHEVLLFGGDRAEIVHRDVYHSVLAPYLEYTKNHTSHVHSPDLNGTDLILADGEEEHDHEKRDCISYTTAVVDTTQTFVDWDVQMSRVVHADGVRTQVTVTEGYQIANAVTVGRSLDLGSVTSILKSTIKIDFTRTWTTTYQQAIMYEITPGYSGTIITKPLVVRRYGRIMEGCLGAMKTKGSYMATAHNEANHNGLSWVQGTVALCQKRIAATETLTRCNGGGYFI